MWVEALVFSAKAIIRRQRAASESASADLPKEASGGAERCTQVQTSVILGIDFMAMCLV